MSFLDSFGDALVLIARGDQEVWRVTAVSLQVSVLALLFGMLAGLPMGYAAATTRHRVGNIASWVFHTLTALPTVVVGLTLYFAFSAAGPLGWMDLLYTRMAMVVGQFILALPILAAITLTTVKHLPAEAHETAITLGLTRARRMQVLREKASTAHRRLAPDMGNYLMKSKFLYPKSKKPKRTVHGIILTWPFISPSPASMPCTCWGA